MSKLKTIVTRILGCLEIALGFTFIAGGMITFAVKTLFNVDAGINVFVVIFTMIICSLLACVGIYYVNPTLWNTVHDKRDDLLLFRIIPDIRVIVDFVDYMAK